MNRLQQIEQFAKLAAYILGRHPDEFGLVPDDSGYIKIKDFLKAVNEIDGWKHIRIHNIQEITLIAQKPTLEIKQDLVRAKDRQFLPRASFCNDPPKLLYACISHKSYPAVSEKGIYPTFHPQVICTENKGLAEKMGKRRDDQPVLLTIHARTAVDKGIKFLRYGEWIYLSDGIPTDCFTGPLLPKESPKPKTFDAIESYKRQAQAGSFVWLPEPSGSKIKDTKKKVNWKKDKKQLRREKRRLWPK